LIIGQLFLVGAIIQSDSKTYTDLEDVESSIEQQYEMQAPDSPKIAVKAAKIKAKKQVVKDKIVKVLDISFANKKPFNIVSLELGQKVKIFKKNKGGKLLRLRIMPTLAPFSVEKIAKFKKKFETFSLHRTNKYSEMVLGAYGRIGNPYITSDDSGLFRLNIPYQQKHADFPIPNGRRIADGVTYYRDRVPIGNRKTDVHILRVEPLSDSIKILPVLANEGICQRETLSSMAKRYNALAAINAAYFTSRGDPIGTLIINRHLISSPLYKRSVFGVTEDGGMLFGNPDFSGTLESGNLSLDIDAVNQPRKGNQLVVFTPEYSRSTLTYEKGIELVLVKGKIVGIHSKDALIPPDGVVVSAGGTKAKKIAALRLGQSVKLDYSIDRPWDLIKHAVCGGPRLINDGKISINGKQEKFSNSIVYGRHPRTAVGLTFDGDLIFVVADGRSKRSAGMKLKELAYYFQRLGARHAINMDGGGSSSMIVKNKIVNKPSDGRERRISNGILITKY
jgi:exopolysaccharide biosynthesis protein